jgi:Ni/Fe-hydrogenase subunit HybB-like protein
MERNEGYRLGFWRGFFYLLVATGSLLTILRYARGLGAVTNLSDAYPWGLWIGFDVLCGVGLAAGGFTIAAVVHIFNVRRFEPILRPAILTAFLGYLLVVVALLFDLGRPWNLWHPLIMWNPRSVLFEVAWCVMLYTTVLALELSEVVFEKLGWKRALRIQHTFLFPLVLVGVILSTLHQSSLGALYLIVPGKLHPLWYTPLLPLFFFVSSVCAGLAMVIVESRLSARAFGRALEMPIVGELGRILVAALGVLGVLRLHDLWSRGALGLALGLSYESLMFGLEFLTGIVLPMALLAFPRVRANTDGLYASSLLVVLGFVVNRLNVSITGLEAAQGRHYVPAWSEVMITLMLVALGFAAFALAVRYLNVYPEEEEEAVAARFPGPEPIAVPGTLRSLRAR